MEQQELLHDRGPDIARAKQHLRSLSDPTKSFEAARNSVMREVEEIHRAAGDGKSVIPELSFADVAAGSVPEASLAEVRRRGCLVIRGVIDPSLAAEWDDELGQYLAHNEYQARAAERAGMDPYFSDLAARAPQIYGVYWSRPQVLLRQAETMAVAKQFLNGLYDTHAPSGPEFDPAHDYTYADRIRRRTPGDTTLGLSPHMDGGSFERWVDPAYQKIYEPVFHGEPDAFDPWSAAYRTQTREYASPAVCSMYRSFQGWTALTPQGPGDGTLSLLPIASSISYLLLRALQPDVPADELCGATPGRSLGMLREWHDELFAGLVSIPLLQPGDTVWWQPDLIHAVSDEHSGSHDSNVIYVGASPRCLKNESYARRQAQHFLEGRSAPDFAAEDFEVNFEGRATADDLTELGRAQMAITPQ